MANIENCVGCRQCAEKCPYQLDTPNVLRYMLQDYREFYEAHKKEL
jgi:Fe-S-cluster-containing dehydrogenase component